MTQDRSEAFAPETGLEFKPALGKLWAMLLVFALMIPTGALAAYCWWYEVELLAGRVLSAKAGIVGLLAVPVGIVLVLIAAAFLASAKLLLIGANCMQLLSRGLVAVHIPYENVAETYATGEAGAGVVGLKLRDRNDPATLVPSWIKDRYEIQTLIYGKPPEHIHQVLKERLAAFRSGAR